MQYICLVFKAFLLSILIVGCSETTGEKLETSTSKIKLELESILPSEINIVSIQETGIDGYLEVKFEGIEPLYISEDGRYLISGDIFQVTSEGLINKSESRRNYYRKTSLNQVTESEFITFQPKFFKHKVFVFTDVDCGYCRQFHKQINDYLSHGIEVNYLAFPRTGIDSTSFNKIASAWCSEDPNTALTFLKLGGEIENNVCDDNPVEKHFKLGGSFGVSGTPTIVTSEGKLIPGYISPEELIGLLEG